MATVLEIEGRADLTAAASDMADLGGEARRLGGELDEAGGAARRAGSDLSGLGDGSDELASKSSQATGALGALAGGLEAVGLEKYAAGLEGAAIATDVMSGAGDALNLIAETAAGRWIVTTAQTVAHTVAVGAQTAATAGLTAAQTALNVVMSLNPIALIVIGLVAATAAIILLWKNSDTFREYAQRAFEVATLGIRTTIAVIELVVNWFRDLGPIARSAWQTVADAVEDKIDDVREFFGDLIDYVKEAPRDAASFVADQFSKMFAPIQDAIQWVQDLIDKIGNIDFPDFPDLNPLDRRASSSSSLEVAGSSSGDLNVTLVGESTPLDPEQRLSDLIDGLREYALRRGLNLTLTEQP